LSSSLGADLTTYFPRRSRTQIKQFGVTSSAHFDNLAAAPIGGYLRARHRENSCAIVSGDDRLHLYAPAPDQERTPRSGRSIVRNGGGIGLAMPGVSLAVDGRPMMQVAFCQVSSTTSWP
jgi:hypothetical protein